MSIFDKFKSRARVTTPRMGTRETSARPELNQPMNLLQVPDLSRKLVTRYGLREKSPCPTLAAEIVPVVLVDDLIGESDLIKPRIRPCAGCFTLVTAAQAMAGGLRNPAGSRVIIHVYYAVVGGSALGAWNLHFTGTPNTGSTGLSAFRNGLFPAQTPIGQIVGDLAGGSPGGVVLHKARHAGNGQAIIPFDAVLDENQALQFQQSGVSTGSYDVSFVWTEEDKG